MITAVTSWRGVGATTTALLLAAEFASDTPVWLIEADPAGGVLAGRIEVSSSALAGLERVAFGPTGSSAQELFEAVAQALGQVRVVVAPADPFRAHTCHRPRVPWPNLLRDLDGHVVVDAGRHRPGSPVGALLRAADLVVAVTSPEVADVVATSEWLRAKGRVAPDEGGVGDVPCVVAVVDAPGGVAFAERTLRADFGEHFGGWISWDSATVDLRLQGVAVNDRLLRRSRLLADVRRLRAAVERAVEVLV